MSYDELMHEYQKTKNEYKQTMAEYNQKLNEYEEKVNENQALKVENENLRLQVNNFKRIIYGVKREHTPKQEQLEISTQCSLFDVEENIDTELQKQVLDNVEEITVYKKKKNKTKKAGIKKSFLKDIAIEVKEYKINENEACPECGSELKEIAKEVVRQEVTYIPAKLVLTNYVQYTYRCTECGGKNSNNASITFVKTKLPNPLLTHSFISPSLATEVIYQKYYLGVPLYRQEKMWDDRGLVLPRNMMANWNIKLAEYYLTPLCDAMFKKLKQENKLAHTDETTIQCNKEEGRNASSNSYMWVYSSGELENIRGTVFHYSPSRSEKTAKEFLTGYKGILVTDGYASYNNIEKVLHVECWAHARRYFYESVPLNESKKMDITAPGYKGVEYCDELFKIEREIAKLSVEEKLKRRQEKSKPVLEAFFEWVKTMNEKIILNKKLKEAITYALNQEKELSQFLNDGQIPLTNSLAERAIRPFAVHRKNWLFADSVAGANANATMYTIIESAKLNNLNIEKYIKYLLDNLPQLESIYDEKSLDKYFPWSKELPEDILSFQGTYEDMNMFE